jgi:hypothetical protein
MAAMYTNPPVTREPRIDELVSVSQLITFPAGEAPFILADLHEGDGPDGRIPLGPPGELSFESPFLRSGPRGEHWTAQARLHPTGRWFARPIRISVTFVLWGADFGELLIRPTARPHTWSAARLERYGALARLAADRLERRARELGQDAPVEVAAARAVARAEPMSSLAA